MFSQEFLLSSRSLEESEDHGGHRIVGVDFAGMDVLVLFQKQNQPSSNQVYSSELLEMIILICNSYEA